MEDVHSCCDLTEARGREIIFLEDAGKSGIFLQLIFFFLNILLYQNTS